MLIPTMARAHHGPPSPAVPPSLTCYEAKTLLKAMTLNGFFPVAELEIEGLPGIIMVAINGEYVVLVLKGEYLCEITHGRGFHPVKASNI